MLRHLIEAGALLLDDRCLLLSASVDGGVVVGVHHASRASRVEGTDPICMVVYVSLSVSLSVYMIATQNICKI